MMNKEKKITFIVITKTPETTDPMQGNMASAFVYDKKGQPVMEALTNYQMEVFDQGEIVIADAMTGREIGGAQRKPSKWHVETEQFDTVEEAVKRSQEVQDD